jgi:hypothetical protein
MPWAGVNKTQGAQGDTCPTREAERGGDGQSDNRTTVIQTRWSQRNASQKMLEATPEADGTTSEATEPPEREGRDSGHSSRTPLARMATDSMTPNHVSQDMRETRHVSDTPNLSPEQSQPAPLPAARAPRAGACLMSMRLDMSMSLSSGNGAGQALVSPSSAVPLSSTRNLICLCSNTQPAARNGHLRFDPVHENDGRWLQHDYYPRR